MNTSTVYLDTVKQSEGKSASALVAQLSKKHPAPYALVVKRRGYISRYYSNSPSFSFAEAWLSQINVKDTRWCLMHIEGERCFIMEVEQGNVMQTASFALLEGEALRHQFGAALALSDVVYCVSETEAYLSLSGLTIERLTPFNLTLSDEYLSAFALKSPTQWRKPLIVVGVGLSMIVASALYLNSPEPQAPREIAQQTLVDPYQAYRHTMSTAASPKAVLENAKALGAYGALLPQGWTLSGIEKNNNQMSLSMVREPSGTLALLNAWGRRHASIAPYLTIKTDLSEVVIPLTADMQQWQDKVIPLQPIVNELFDRLVSFGWSVTGSVESLPPIQSFEWELNQPALPVYQLSYLAQVLSGLPVVIDKFSMQPTSVLGHYNTTLSISLKGVSDE